MIKVMSGLSLAALDFTRAVEMGSRRQVDDFIFFKMPSTPC